MGLWALGRMRERSLIAQTHFPICSIRYCYFARSRQIKAYRRIDVGFCLWCRWLLCLQQIASPARLLLATDGAAARKGRSCDRHFVRVFAVTVVKADYAWHRPPHLAMCSAPSSAHGLLCGRSIASPAGPQGPVVFKYIGFLDSSKSQISPAATMVAARSGPIPMFPPFR